MSVVSAVFEGVGVTAVQDLFSLASPTSGIGRLLSVFISQESDVGDAAEEILAVKIITGNTTVGSGGTAPTAIPRSLGNTPTATVRANDTTEVSVGTAVIKHSDTFNIRVGWQYIPTPEERIVWNELIAGTTTFLAVQLITTPNDSITMTGTITWDEEHG